MKYLLIIGFLFCLTINLFAQDEILEGDINQNMFLTSDKTYLLRNTVRVQSPSKLSIEPGTTIYGESRTGGALIIKPGAQLIAKGTPGNPIVFTSDLFKTNKYDSIQLDEYWGGIILLGNAPINMPGGKASIVGSGDEYGGNNVQDSSGELEYVRIEFAGVFPSSSSYTAGLVLGGVGNETKINHIQSSFARGDAFSFFGGTVHCNNLLAYNCGDDDFDFDFGYSGNLQFLLSIRDKEIAYVSGANGFESDNDGSSSLYEPRTSPIVFNATLIGPIENNQTIFNQFYKCGMNIRRSSQGGYSNILIMGWPTGLLVDGKVTKLDAQNGNWYLKNSIISGSRINDLDTIRTDGAFDIHDWFINNNNKIFLSNDEAKLIDPFNQISPQPFPLLDSPVLIGAAIPPDDGFFDTNAIYIGAFGESNWLEGWTKFNYGYSTDISKTEMMPIDNILLYNYPNPFNPVTQINYQLSEKIKVQLKIYNTLGQEIATLVNCLKEEGYHSIRWDAHSHSSGVYYYRMVAGSHVETKKMLLLK